MVNFSFVTFEVIAPFSQIAMAASLLRKGHTGIVILLNVLDIFPV